jgi:dTDP-4-amino-4,6-dideoxygalactose transaminase
MEKQVNRIEFGEFRTNDVMRQHIQECLDNNWVTMGPKVEQLEKEFAEKFGYKHAVMTSSGTTADMAALMALYEFGANPQDEIIVPALSFIATSNAVRAAGFKPVWVDIRRETLNINEDLIEEKITNKTRAILSVNTMGKPCNMVKLREIADKYNLKLISDSCESHLCTYHGKLMSYYADMCTYSAFTAHILMCSEGGFVGTNNSYIADLIKSIRSHGRPTNSLYFSHERYGLNFKPTDLHASIGLGSLSELGETYQKRDKNLRKIRNECGFLRQVAYLSEEEENTYNCPHGFSVTVKNPNHFDILKITLDRYDIHWKLNFACVPTQHRAFKLFDYQEVGSYPESEFVGNNGLHIGCHPYLTDEDIKRIIEAFRAFYNEVTY